MNMRSICLLGGVIYCLSAPAQTIPGLLKQDVRYIPSKTFASLSFKGQDTGLNYTSRWVTVKGFLIGRTEVTNKQYREFVNYVRDSIARELLGHAVTAGNRIDWNHPGLAPLMLSVDENLTGTPRIDPGKLLYALYQDGNKELISVYPDTLVWMRDFSFSFNEPLVKRYFSHPSFDDYPVVGVTARQAMAFCQWKTNEIRKKRGVESVTIRLPTNSEWEAAATGQRDTVAWTSGQGYTSNFGTISDNGFIVKDYADDGFFYTGPVRKFPPTRYGLYDMTGNVGEWTSTRRSEIMNENSTKADYFAVKGGGWDSGPFYLQTGVCRFISGQAAHSFIGFRYVVEMPTEK